MTKDTISPLNGGKVEDILGAPLLSIVEHYIAYYAKGETNTARAKRNDLNHFIRFLSHYLGKADTELTGHDWDHAVVSAFVEYCLNKGEAPSTASRRLATLKHMGRVLAERIPSFINPARDVKFPVKSTFVPKAVPDKELKKILDLAKEVEDPKLPFKEVRDRVLFLTLLETGLRAEEIRLLRMKQIDETGEWFTNVRTKGRKFRNVYITRSLRRYLEVYIKRRAEQIQKKIGTVSKEFNKKMPLFISLYGASREDPDSFLMGAKTIWRSINRFSLTTSLHPHILRHSFAHNLLENTCDVRLVAQALGHSDVRVTMRYTERTEKDIAGAIENSDALKKA